MIELEFLGAAQTVTGSKHLLKTSHATVLIECGLFQGHRRDSAEKNRNIPVDPGKIDAVVLSHAHIDHSGALPALYKMGYRGPIYATPATRDLCSPMWMDTAQIMKFDSAHVERLIEQGHKELQASPPLYDANDVRKTLTLTVGLPYHRKQLIAPGVHLTFFDAGHILGSAICVLDIQDENRNLRLAFTGDLGRKHLPILRNPETPEGVSVLLMESTYGDRMHEPIELTTQSLAQIVNETVQRGGKIVIPTFALERAQEVIYVLRQLSKDRQIPQIPVYVDSPLTVQLTEVFKLHPECYDSETFSLLTGRESPFDFQGLKYVSSVEESKEIDLSQEPSIILSASGMCEAGRILHHLHATIEDSKNTIIIVGFQAENTLGRKLVEGQTTVPIFGIQHRREAQVKILNGFSGHADQNGLIQFAKSVQSLGNLKRTILVHGDPKSQEVLKNELHKRGIQPIDSPKEGAKTQL